MPHRPGRGTGVVTGQARAGASARSSERLRREGGRLPVVDEPRVVVLHDAQGLAAGLVVVHQPAEHRRDRDDELVGLHVEEAQLQVATARPHRREQRGEVVRHGGGVDLVGPRPGGEGVGSSGSPAGIANTAAPAAKSAYAATGSSPRSSRSSNAVRPGSTDEPGRQPRRGSAAAREGGGEERPGQQGSRHCSRPAAPGHQSRHTCVEAVWRIIRRPAGPIRSKWRCIPTYRGLVSCRGTSSGCGSTGVASSATPARAQSARSAPMVRSHARARSVERRRARKAQLDLAAGLEPHPAAVRRSGDRPAHPVDRHGRPVDRVPGEQLVLDADPRGAGDAPRGKRSETPRRSVDRSWRAPVKVRSPV